MVISHFYARTTCVLYSEPRVFGSIFPPMSLSNRASAGGMVIIVKDVQDRGYLVGVEQCTLSILVCIHKAVAVATQL